MWLRVHPEEVANDAARWNTVAKLMNMPSVSGTEQVAAAAERPGLAIPTVTELSQTEVDKAVSKHVRGHQLPGARLNEGWFGMVRRYPTNSVLGGNRS